MDGDHNIEVSRTPKRRAKVRRLLLWSVIALIVLVLLSCGSLAAFVSSTKRTVWLGIPSLVIVEVGRYNPRDFDPMWDPDSVVIPSVDTLLPSCGGRGWVGTSPDFASNRHSNNS